jgi:hypothetical protein
MCPFLLVLRIAVPTFAMSGGNINWKFEAGGKAVDLTQSKAYDHLYHTRWQRFARWCDAFGRSAISSGKGLWDLRSAMGERSKDRKSLDRTVQLLYKDRPRSTGQSRSKSMAVLREDMYQAPAAGIFMREVGGPATGTGGKKDLSGPMVKSPKGPKTKLSKQHEQKQTEVDLDDYFAGSGKSPSKSVKPKPVALKLAPRSGTSAQAQIPQTVLLPTSTQTRAQTPPNGQSPAPSNELAYESADDLPEWARYYYGS